MLVSRLPLVSALALAACHRSGSVSLLFEEVEDTAAVEDATLSSDDEQDLSDRNGKATILRPGGGRLRGRRGGRREADAPLLHGG
jgi:hypothetical protein